MRLKRDLIFGFTDVLGLKLLHLLKNNSSFCFSVHWWIGWTIFGLQCSKLYRIFLYFHFSSLLVLED